MPLIFAEELNLKVDANGNLITGDSFYREFNELNQLVRVRGGNTSSGPILFEYIWHPLEERILVKDVFHNGIRNYSIYYVNDNYVHIENSSGNYSEKYLYIDDQLVAFVDTGGNKRFVHSDHLGSVSLITDVNGNTVEETFYSPHGEILAGGKTSRFDYEGKEFDSVTGRLDFGFRQFNPRIPVWDNPDTLIQNVYDSQSLNRHMFERGNPLKNVDPSGHQFGKILEITGTRPEIRNIEQAPPGDAKEASKIVNDNLDIVMVQDQGLGIASGGLLGTGYREKTAIGGTENGIVYANPDGTYSWEWYIKPKKVETGNDLNCQELHICNAANQGSSPRSDKELTTSPSNSPTAAQPASQANSALNINTGSSGGGGSSRSSSAGTSSFGRGSPSQIVRAAGGSTLKTAAQRAASESLAAKIINKQREVAKKAVKKGGKK